MFDQLSQPAKFLQLMQRLLADETVRALVSHPKVQAVLMDPEFQQLVKSQDVAKLLAFPKLAALMQDPELAPLFAKVNFPALLQGSS